MKTMREIAKEYAIKCHRNTNHQYNGLPYEYHLNEVVSVAESFLDLLPDDMADDIIAACWCHDVIEDCRQTYNDVKNATNQRVAELVYAVTNEKGRNRKERANFKFYEEMGMVPGAGFVKICDRIANYEYSIQTNSKMADMYKKENDSFIANVYSASYEKMLNRLRLQINSREHQ